MKTYDHPGFRDVYMVVHAKTFIPEGKRVSLKISWVRRKDGRMLCLPYRIKITQEKFKTFKRVG